MEPLSDEDSKRLFCKRIFSSESWCPPEYETISRDILKKCGGVPLAIISIASLLASGQHVKPKNEWDVLLESIGCGLTGNRSVKEMLRILSFSYYDLPSHLKTCLLYLSLFPEDHKIVKDQLIWMWIAEGFVHCGVATTSVFEMGETYFNELVNRSLIQPVYDGIGGFVYACRVHDSVLDLICSLSREENFVTIVNATSGSMSFHTNIRRLSIQSARKEDETLPLRYESKKKMRSVVIFKHVAGLMEPFSNFIALRVLDLLGYDGFEGHLNIRELCSLIHLRYLRLPRQHLDELPEEIGKLQFLQVLDFPGSIILPSTLIKLTRLMCLTIHGGSSLLPDGIGNLTSMEVMGGIKVGSVSLVKELGNMDKMRELIISFKSLGLVEAFVESLRKMRRIQHLEIGVNYESEIEVSMDLLGERWVPPETIQKFIMSQGTILSKLPAWNPYHLSQLSNLQLCVKEVGQEDLGFLGRLSALRYLELWIRRQTPLLISAEEFCCLEQLYLISNSPTQILFQPGALTKAKKVIFCIRLPVAKEEATGNSGDWLEVGMGNLPSLCNVIVRVGYCGLTVGEARQAKAALKNVLRAHPNSPTFKIYSVPNMPQGANDDDVCIEDGVLDGYGSDYIIEDVCSEDGVLDGYGSDY